LKRKTIRSVLLAIAFGVSALLPFGTALAEKVVLMAWSDPARWQGLVDGFLADNPGWPHEVEIQVTPQDGAPYRESLLTMLAGGAGPDIWLVDPNWLEFHQWLRDGLFVEELTPYLERDGVSADSMWPVFKDLGGDGMRLFSLPLHIIPQTMYYNKTRVSELGLVDPAELYKIGDWTFDNFLSAAKAVTRDQNGDGEADQWALMNGFLSAWLSWSYVWTSGGDYFDREITRSLADAPGTIAGVEFLSDLYHQHGVVAPEGTPGSPAGFMAGHFAFDQNWGHLPGTFVRSEIDFEWGVVLPPKADVNAEHYTPTTQGFWVMNKDSHAKEAAWDLLKWLGSPAGNLAWLRATYYHGIAHPAIFESDYFLNLISEPGWPDNFAEIYFDLYMNHSRSRPHFPEAAEWERMTNEYFVQIRRGQIPVQTALSELARRSNQLLGVGE